jgi:HEAT repeat protein
MSASRFVKAGCAFLLAFGLMLLAGYDDLMAANKAEEAKKLIETLKKTKDAKVKADALEELGKIGQVMYKYVEDGIPLMFDALKDKDAKVRAAAALAIGRVGPDDTDKAVTALTDLVKDDKDEGVRMAAAQGLGAIGSKASKATKDLRTVRKGLTDTKGKLAKSIDAALKSIQPPREKGKI